MILTLELNLRLFPKEGSRIKYLQQSPGGELIIERILALNDNRINSILSWEIPQHMLFFLSFIENRIFFLSHNISGLQFTLSLLLSPPYLSSHSDPSSPSCQKAIRLL